jgi:hypothetical protein
MNNPEKLATKEKQNKQKNKQKTNTMFVGHHYLQAKTNTFNKTCALLQTTGGKDESNVICMRKSQHGSQSVKTHNRRTQKS